MEENRAGRRLFLGALVGSVLFLGSLAGEARGEVVRGEGSPSEKSRADEGAPAGEDGADAGDAANGDAEERDRAIDAIRLETLRLRFAGWTRSGETSSKEGLSLRGVILPDALAYKTLDRYLDLRKDGHDHPAAIERLGRSLDRWKRYENRSLVLLEVENERYEVATGTRRVYTLEKSLQREGITLHMEKRGLRSRRLPFALAGKPGGLRIARLRVKKFWKTADGATRRVTPRDQARLDPASIGRDPLLSRPFAGLVIEGEPVELELLISRKAIELAEKHQVALHHWKRYEGPWEKDVLDLNQGRPWKEITGVAFTVALPPSGTTVSPEVRELVEEVREKARAARRGLFRKEDQR